MKTLRWFCAFAAMATLPAATPLAAQQSAEIIRGRVTGPDSLPVANAIVTTISFQGGITKTTKTDRNGRFAITYPNGEGDYWITFAAIGFAPRRFEVKRIADEAILIADTRLTPAVQAIERVEVTTSAARQAPPRTGGAGNDIGGSERSVSGALLTADQLGNLAAMAAAMAGIQLIPGVDGNPDMFSALGLDPSQNNTTLNGVPTDLSGLPADAGVSASLRTGSGDISVGGFSGAQLNVNVPSGTNFILRGLSSNFTAPQIQWTDNVGGETQENTRFNFGGYARGPIEMNRIFYSTSYGLTRGLRDQLSLVNTSAAALQNAGVSPDSVARLNQILGASGIPVNAGVPGDLTQDNASLLAAFDFSPRSATSGHSYKVTANGSWSGTAPTGAGLTSMPSYAGKNSSIGGALQVRHTNYFGAGILTQTTVAAQANRASSEPYLMLPSGSVRIASELDDASVTQRNLQFGGNTNAQSESSSSAFSFMNSLFWVSPNNRHTVRVATELRHQAFENETPASLGMFSYQSLADLEAGAPSAFTRRLNAQRRSGSGVNAAIGIGDSWIPRPGIFQMQYGLRFDGAHYFDAPERNAAVEETFGVANNHVPNRLYVSPRFGFTWTYGKAAQLPFATGFVSGPRAILRGGLSANQSAPGPQFLSNAVANTGLPGSTLSLSCVGAAAPVADWEEYLFNPGAVPTQCADGTEGTVFASSRPNVTMFDRRYRSPRSVNANLAWTGATLGNRFMATVVGTYSFQMNQTSTIDLNFNPVVQFSLDNESGRPVFAEPTSIVPGTGLIASRGARVSDDFGRVSLQRSDLRAEARQISLTLNPLNYNPTRFNYTIGYAYLNRVDQFNGFSSTIGNPLDRAWGTSGAPQHDIRYSFSYNFGGAVTLIYGGSLQSPRRFTPMIAGDVNGDGGGFNDRAFVFDPSAAADPDVAAGMQALLASGSSSARECLQAQMGRLASRNSCSGPWSLVNQSITVRLNAQRVWLPPRTNISLTLSNPLAAADLLLHGDNNLRGWGQRVNPDQSLLYVRGFDPATNRYRYEVNQRFGSTALAQTTAREPARLSLLVSYDLGPPRDWQSFQMRLMPGRAQPGNKVTEAQLRGFSTGIVINPMARILAAADELKLSRQQADSIAKLSRGYTLFIDSLWVPTAKYMAELGDQYNRGHAQERFVAVRNAAIDYLMKVVPNVRSLLTGGQKRVLPQQVSLYLEPRFLENLRNGATSIAGIRFF